MKKSLPSHKQHLGRKGEDIAVQTLKQKGYVIISRNFKARYGEIDIIARDKDTIVFVEVKTRISTKYGTPREAVGYRKIRELLKTVAYWEKLHITTPVLMRVDVMAIILSSDSEVLSVDHILNITG